MAESAPTSVDDFTVETTGQDPQPIAVPPPVAATAVSEALPAELDVDLDAEVPAEPELPLEPPAAVEPEKVRQKETYGSKIGRLKAEKDAAENRAAELAAQLAARDAAAQPQQAPPPPDHNDPEPQLDHFLNEADPYLALTKASARWSARQEQRELMAAIRREQQRESWNKHILDAKQKYQDYDAVMVKGRSFAITPEVEQALIESDIGPMLTYHLIQHPEEYRQIVALRGTALAKAVGKLEARLETVPGQVQTTPVPPKPAPITPVQSSSGKAAESFPDDLEFGPEYVRQMNAKDIRERGRLR